MSFSTCRLPRLIVLPFNVLNPELSPLPMYKASKINADFNISATPLFVQRKEHNVFDFMEKMITSVSTVREVAQVFTSDVCLHWDERFCQTVVAIAVMPSVAVLYGALQ